MKFEWDQRKDASNRQKHGVGFREAASVFADPLSITFRDIDHSFSEERFLTMGLSVWGRALLIAHTENEEAIRIISARLATIREKRFYEENEPE
ncbi:MAG TPA: BrnT family toxin [Terriglobales bacterium]|nr:BrnT family toxin [Terriglobales bacterium]